ncbi:MAG: hypothetical protein ABSB28_10540 [Candidatus Bathyarchaeia archaeon]
MARYNERKLQVLEYVRQHPTTTSSDLASALDLEIHNARTLLKKYSRQGLLSRRSTDSWGTRIHEITEKGLRRLKWLRGEEIPRTVEEEETPEDAAQATAEPEPQVVLNPISPKEATPISQFIRLLEIIEQAPWRKGTKKSA